MATRLIGTDDADPWLPDVVKVKAAKTQVVDAAGKFTATEVEGVLAELQGNIEGVVLSEGMTGITVDTGELYRLIMFSDGTTNAIPVDHFAPVQPTGLAAAIRVSSVRLTWAGTPGAVSYRIYRDDSLIGTATTETLRDSNVTVGETYEYTVQAVSYYRLRSPLSDPVTAFIDPALNVAPTVEVRVWPTTIALGNRAVVRVNATDVDAQLLALTLGTDVGSLIATDDPSVWYLVPA